MNSRILIVEDNNHKRDNVISFIKDIINNVIIDEAYSFTSGCQKAFAKDYDLIIIDMSLPTYDKTTTENGGKFRPFGGREIARKIIRKKLKLKMIFITQYKSFSDKGRSKSLDALKDELKDEYGDQYISLIYYDSSMSIWKDNLQTAINDCYNKK